MRAAVGDELVVRGRHVDDHDRDGVIIEIHGENGSPPYLVRWEMAGRACSSPRPTPWSSIVPAAVRPALQGRDGGPAGLR